MLSKTTKNTSGLLWGSLISAVPEAGNQEIHRGLGNGFRNRSGLYKTDNFYAFVGFPPFRRSQKPEIQKSTGALEMASGKGADSTKSTNFWFLWGSPFFGGPRSRKSRKSTGALEMASGKGADCAKSTNFGLLWGSLHFGCPRAGNPGNPQGPWKWLPEKERTVQNRRLLWGSLHFGGPRSRKSKKSTGAGNGFRKRSGLYKIDKFWVFVGFPLFRRSQKPEIRKSTGALEMASGKGADCTKSTTFGLL